MRRDLPTLAIGETPLHWTRISTKYDGATGWLHSDIATLPGDEYVGHIGSSGRDHEAPDWPNRTEETGRTVARTSSTEPSPARTASPLTMARSISPNG